jgi:hypothetical protein
MDKVRKIREDKEPQLVGTDLKGQFDARKPR